MGHFKPNGENALSCSALACSHLALNSRNSSYILMTNWLAAGLVLPHAAIISFPSQKDMNKGRLTMLQRLMHTNSS